MSTNSSSRYAAIGEALAPLHARWKARPLRERRAALAAAWLVGLLLLWVLAIAPAWRTASLAPARLDQLDNQLQMLQRMAGEARELRALASIPPTQAIGVLRAATDALGGAGRLQASSERATLTLSGVSSAQLRDWLAEARSNARARPIEANLTRGPTGFTGSIVVALPAGAAP